MKVCVETFGCRLNRAESLDMEAEFVKRGWLLTDDHEEADMIVVRGCSVTSRAESDSYAFVDHIKRKYPLKRVVVTGCLSKRMNEHWLKDLPERSVDVVPMKTARAYLKVQDGCAGSCAFCTVPKFRGKSESIDFTSVLDRARTFIDRGYTEIVVTGCNLSLYASSGKRLPDLLAALADLAPGEARIRLGSLEPSDVAFETVEAIASRENICRYLHVPVQSGAETILAAMKRPYTVKRVDELLRRAAALMPLAGIGCDMISGYPGESPIQHKATISFLERHPFSNVHAFPFSARPGTPAASLSGQVPRGERSARAREISSFVEKKRFELAKKFIGSTVEVVIENVEHASGWTGEYFRVRAEGQENKLARRLKVRVKVREADGDRLYGRMV